MDCIRINGDEFEVTVPPKGIWGENKIWFKCSFCSEAHSQFNTWLLVSLTDKKIKQHYCKTCALKISSLPGYEEFSSFLLERSIQDV